MAVKMKKVTPLPKLLNQPGIYIIKSPKRKVYIGQSVNIKNRYRYYEGGHVKGQVKVYASIKKYGFKKHTFNVLQYCERHELNNLEHYYIKLYNSFDTPFGLNLTSGGDRVECSVETKLKRSIALKGRVFTEEWKRRIGQKSIGRMVGFKHSEESIQKMRGKKRPRPEGFVPYNKGKGYSKEEARLRHNEANKRLRARKKLLKIGNQNKENRAA